MQTFFRLELRDFQDENALYAYLCSSARLTTAIFFLLKFISNKFFGSFKIHARGMQMSSQTTTERMMNKI